MIKQVELLNYVAKTAQCNKISLARFEFEFSKVQHPTRHIIGHFGDESSQAINYTGTDNEKVTN